MASNLKLGTNGRNAACDAIVDLLDSGTVKIRTGAPPTNPSDASSGTLLATVTFNATAFGDAASGVATANDFTADSDADASGDAGHFRIYASGGGDTDTVLQGTAGEAGDTPDMTFDNKSIVAGGIVDITAMTITVAE